MAFQSVPETCQIFTAFNSNGERWGNTHYASKVGGYDEAALQAVADAVDEWVGTELLPNMSADTNYLGTVVRGLENEEDFEVTSVVNIGVGGQTGATLPNNVAFVAKRLSGLTGRSARGRVYLGGMRSGNLTAADQNQFGAATIITFLNALGTLATYLTGEDWIEVIVSRFTSGLKRAFGVTHAVTEWSYTDAQVDTQRGRLT